MNKSNLNLIDLLMQQANALTAAELTGEELRDQVQKAQALTGIAEQVINLKDVSLREIDVNMKAVKIAASLGMAYKPQNIKLEKLPDPDALDDDDLNNGYRGTKKRGLTPEGLEYEL